MINIPDRIGPYRVIEPLGKGGMGMVYRCEHIQTGTTLAVKTVKVPHPGQIEGIRREIRALARLDHPGVVRILDEGIHDGLPFYAMDFLTGVSLRQFCAEFVWGTSSISTAWMHDKANLQFWNRDGTATTPPVIQEILGPTLANDQLPDISNIETSQPPSSASPSKYVRIPASGGQMDAVLSIILRLASTLAYLHGEGIIHGDLKPENILIRPDGFPVIIDFGLVTQIWTRESRESLEIESIKGGTLIYLAPEVLSGAMCDARADIYSFGCILFELLTGKPPITGQSTFELLKQKMEGMSVPPSNIAFGIPDWLDRLVVKMLARHPRDRVPYADDVKTTLIQYTAAPKDIATFPKPRAYLYRSQFAGRKNEISHLRTHLDQLDAGTGKLILIGGESGIGKTRVMMKLYRDVSRRRMLALPGECIRGGSGHPSEAGAFHEPLHPLKQPLRMVADFCLEHGPEISIKILGPRGKILAAYEPMLTQLPGQSTFPDPPALPANAARLRLYTALCDVLSQISTIQKVVLFIDDLQWADDLTNGFIEFALRIGLFSRYPIMIIGSFRIEEETDSITRIRKDPRCDTIILTKLNQEAVGTIIAEMMALQQSNSHFAQFLTQFSEGNPFFITEYLRTAVAEEILFRDPNGIWQVHEESDRKASIQDFEVLPLPRALSDLIHRRLEALSSSARDVMHSAAVLGKEFPSILLWHLISASDSMFDTIDELISRQILVELSSGEMCFSHDKIRETIYNALDPDYRRNLHHLAAKAIESLYGEANDLYFASLAHHWQCAEDSQKARHYHLAYARQTARKYSLSEAEKSFRIYLDLSDDADAESIRVRIEFCETVLIVIGRHIEALDQYRLTAELAHTAGLSALEARSNLGMSRMCRVLGDMKRAHQHCSIAQSLYKTIQDFQGLAAVQTCFGELFSHQGKIADARVAFEEGLRLYRELNVQDSIANTLSGLAPIYCMQGDHVSGRALFEEALLLYRKTGDRQGEGGTLGNIANIYLYCGETDRARVMYEESIALLREIGDMRNQGIILGNLARIYQLNGNLETAQQLFEQSLMMQRTIQNRRMEGITLSKLADIFMVQGDVESARDMYREATTILEEVDDHHQIAVLQINIAEMERITNGNYDLAEKILKNAEATFKEMNYHLGIGMCAGQLGLIALMRGESCTFYYDSLRHLMEITRSGPETHLGHILHNLELSEQTIRTGETLFRGERIDRIQPGLRRWLERNGQIPISGDSSTSPI